MGLLNRWAPWLVGPNGLEIGPIPVDTPVGLLANLPFVSDSKDLDKRIEHFHALLGLLGRIKGDLKALGDNPTDDQARAVFANVVPDLLRLSKCPDYVVNRGHYFGTNLGDDDKWALIEFLKTF